MLNRRGFRQKSTIPTAHAKKYLWGTLGFTVTMGVVGMSKDKRCGIGKMKDPTVVRKLFNDDS